MLLSVAAGCGTTRMTDTQRTATEQLLVSHAIDQVVSELDFSTMAGKSVFFDPQFLDGVVDRGYLASSLRQQLLAAGCLLQEDRAKATYVVEARSGGVGTNRHALLVGVPQMNVPTLVPGQPSQIPEIPLAKKTDQEGIAKVAVFAYNRQTGQPVWQSGVVQATSTSRDTWVLGAGPFEQGTIRKGTEFAGQRIPVPQFRTKAPADTETASSKVAVTAAATWPEMPAPKTDAKRLAYVLGTVPAEERLKISETNQAMLGMVAGDTRIPSLSEGPGWPWNQLPIAGATIPANPLPAPARPGPAPEGAPNKGGAAETEPSQIFTSGFAFEPVTQTKTAPGRNSEPATGSKPDGAKSP
jgi:hypothetical protein